MKAEEHEKEGYLITFMVNLNIYPVKLRSCIFLFI